MEEKTCRPLFTSGLSWETFVQTLTPPPVCVRDLFRILSLFAGGGVDADVDAAEAEAEAKETLIALAHFFQDHLSPSERDAFFHHTLPRVVSLALRLPVLFPERTLPLLRQGVEGRVVLTREQVACLLAHMFFLTTSSRFGLMGCGNFLPYFQILLGTEVSPTEVYLRALFLHFDHLAAGLVPLEETLTFRRHALQSEAIPCWKDTRSPLCHVDIRTEGAIGDHPGEVELDFANEDIGFGVTATQEEILFGMSPEMCVVCLFCPTMQENEAVLIRGMTRVGACTGYGSSLRWKGPWEEPHDWSQRRVLAIDALPVTSLSEQLAHTALTRELNKAFCGFSLAQDDSRSSPVRIGSGHWGCGVFGGNKPLKAILQWAAASQAACGELGYYTFGGTDFALAFQRFVEGARGNGATVSDLYRTVLAFREIVDKQQGEEEEQNLFSFFPNGPSMK